MFLSMNPLDLRGMHWTEQVVNNKYKAKQLGIKTLFKKKSRWLIKTIQRSASATIMTVSINANIYL